MAANLDFPVFILATRDGVVVANTGDRDCFMLFHAKDLAEQEIAKIQRSHPNLGLLHALSVPNAQALRNGLKSLPADVVCAVWDPQATPAGFAYIGIDELIRATESV
jgi:hypothetical protein